MSGPELLTVIATVLTLISMLWSFVYWRRARQGLDRHHHAYTDHLVPLGSGRQYHGPIEVLGDSFRCPTEVDIGLWAKTWQSATLWEEALRGMVADTALLFQEMSASEQDLYALLGDDVNYWSPGRVGEWLQARGLPVAFRPGWSGELTVYLDEQEVLTITDYVVWFPDPPPLDYELRSTSLLEFSPSTSPGRTSS